MSTVRPGRIAPALKRRGKKHTKSCSQPSPTRTHPGSAIAAVLATQRHGPARPGAAALWLLPTSNDRPRFAFRSLITQSFPVRFGRWRVPTIRTCPVALFKNTLNKSSPRHQSQPISNANENPESWPVVGGRLLLRGAGVRRHRPAFQPQYLAILRVAFESSRDYDGECSGEPTETRAGVRWNCPKSNKSGA